MRRKARAEGGDSDLLGRPRNKENKALQQRTPNWGASKGDFLKRILSLLPMQLFSSAKNKVGLLGQSGQGCGSSVRSPFTSTNSVPAKPTLHPYSELHTPSRRGPGVGAKKTNPNHKALLEYKVEGEKDSFKTGTHEKIPQGDPFTAAVAAAHPSIFLKRKKGGTNAYDWWKHIGATTAQGRGFSEKWLQLRGGPLGRDFLEARSCPTEDLVLTRVIT